MDPKKLEAVRAATRLSRVFEKQLGEESISLPQFRLLAFLSDGEWAASAVADWLAVSRPSVTALVDGLVEKGWVTREHSPTDRRRVLHHLTDAGRSRVEAASQSLVERLDGLLEHLDDEETQQVLDGFALLHVAMQRARDAVSRP